MKAARVTLAPFVVWDVGLWWALATDPRVRAYLGGVLPVWPRMKAFARDVKSARRGNLWCARAQGRQIGLVYLVATPEPGTMELSYLFRADVWGQGLASEAVALVLQTAQQRFPDARIVAETQAGNVRPRQLLAGQGFVETARLTRFGAEQICFEWRGARPG
ncbi:MAG: GNAT family N-acetyltransferase [Pseudomonadota bacterium]